MLAGSSLDFDFECSIAAKTGFDFDSDLVDEFVVDFVVVTAAKLEQAIITPADSGSVFGVDSWAKSSPAFMLVRPQFSWIPELSLFQQKFALDFQAYFDAVKCCLNSLSF